MFDLSGGSTDDIDARVTAVRCVANEASEDGTKDNWLDKRHISDEQILFAIRLYSGDFALLVPYLGFQSNGWVPSILGAGIGGCGSHALDRSDTFLIGTGHHFFVTLNDVRVFSEAGHCHV